MLGGDWLVKGAVALAERMGISPLVIGLTIVALGTSAPELVISIRAAFAGEGSLAIGNVVGSNIANVLLVLGAPALLATMHSTDDDLKPSLFFVTGLTVAFMLQLYWGPVTYVDGLLLLACLFAFLVQQYISAQKQTQSQQEQHSADYHEELGELPQSTTSIIRSLVIGFVALPVGAALTVDNAVEIAMQWHVPSEIIGLTVIAIGTSLPELATGIMAARHGNTSVAIGNVIGSNFFNIAAIMGLTATAAGLLQVGEHIVIFDMWVMLASTLLLVIIALLKASINRTIGVLFLASYLVYLVSTFII